MFVLSQFVSLLPISGDGSFATRHVCFITLMREFASFPIFAFGQFCYITRPSGQGFMPNLRYFQL